jgi:pimeloyl-ACP methyl ester carboxylesterase
MVYPTIVKRKRFDHEADAVIPPRNREFKMKERAKTDKVDEDATNQPTLEEDHLKGALRGPVLSEAEIEERAYASPEGVYVYGDTEAVAGSRDGTDWAQNVGQLGIPFLKTGKPNTEELDKFKAAEKAYLAHPGIKRLIGHSQGGAVAIALAKKYPGLAGNVYGTPYVDILGKEAVKDTLNEERNNRNQFFGDKWYYQPAKFVGNKAQDLLERAVGLSDVKGVKEPGIERYANVGDPVAMFDGSATRGIHPEPWKYKSFTHDYHNLAGDKFTADASKAYGQANPDGTVSLFM